MSMLVFTKTYKRDYKRTTFKSKIKELSFTTKRLDPKGFTKVNKKRPIWKESLFKVFLRFNTWIPYNDITVHATFVNYYYINTHYNTGFFNIKKLFNTWINILLILTNIFFYQLNYTVFSNSYFRYEVLSLNWQYNVLFRKALKYNYAFICFFNNKTTAQTEVYFRRLIRLKYKIAFVVDIYYHKRTLHYFNKLKFITIGPVPISSNLYSLTFAVPAATNSVFSNLFFLRLVLKLQRLNSQLLWETYYT